MKHTKNMVINNTVESRELSLFADNESTIYPFIVDAVRKCAKHYKRGDFDATKAIDAFYPAANYAARLYTARFGSGTMIFDVTARYTAANDLLRVHMDNIIENDY